MEPTKLTQKGQEELLRIKQMLDSNLITQEEFEKKKKQIFKVEESNNKITLIATCVIFISILIVVLITIISVATKPKKDITSFSSSVNSYCNTVSVVKDVRITDDGRVYLTVDSDIWNNASSTKKAEFCYNMNKNLSVFAVKYNISEYGASVYYYGTNGLELAKPAYNGTFESDIIR